jgi:mannan endo-1,4-beta-mannosidase
VAAKKPCLFEEYGVMAEEKCSQQTGWQNLAINTKGVAGDMYWQYGDNISSGLTADDRFTVFRGSKNWDCMVDAHGKDIRRLSPQPKPKIRFL